MGGSAYLVYNLRHLLCVGSSNLCLLPPNPIIITGICCITFLVTSISLLHKQLLLESLGLYLLLWLCWCSRCYALLLIAQLSWVLTN